MRNNEMKRRSRWLSLLLVAILVISMLVPVTAFADDGYHNYTIVFHANRPGRGYWSGESDKYVADYTYTYEDYSSDETITLSYPYAEESLSPAGYAEYYDGYSFNGYAKAASGAVITTPDEDGDLREIACSNLTPDGTTHLYAQWKKTSYVVTYDAGKQGYFFGGRYDDKTGTYVRQKYQKDCESYHMDNSAADRLCEPWPIRVYSPAQYAFDGWYFDAAFKSAVPDAGFTVTKDVTLYAKYIDKAAVSKSQSEGAAAKAAATSYYNKAAKAAKKLKVTGTKASAAGKKKANVKWKANKKANGYQIQYSLKKNFKNAKTVNVKGAKKKIRKLKGMKKGKTYYIRIRTYQNVLGVNNTKVPVYGKWSKKMKVKVK